MYFVTTHLIQLILTLLRVVNSRLVPIMPKMPSRHESITTYRIQDQYKHYLPGQGPKPTVIPRTTSNQNSPSSTWRMDTIYYMLDSARENRKRTWERGPAWETESPASSISWSMEKAPALMRSVSRAAAFLAESVWVYTSVSGLRIDERSTQFLPSKPLSQLRLSFKSTSVYRPSKLIL